MPCAALRQEGYRARGEDHHAAIEISLEDAIQGAEREITLRALDRDAQGRAAIVNRTLSVKIPTGVHPGQYIRLGGYGMPGQAASRPETSTSKSASRPTRCTAYRGWT